LKVGGVQRRRIRERARHTGTKRLEERKEERIRERTENMCPRLEVSSA
jgi:hypothetical protein